MSSLKSKIAAVAAMAVAGGAAAVLTATSAAAVTTPAAAITNDPNASLGNVVFYNSAGQIVTSGSNLNKIFDFAAATSAAQPGATKATIYFAFPDHTQADSNNWNSQLATASHNFPVASPAPLKNFSVPVGSAGSGEADLKSLLATSTLDHTTGYDGIVQVRLYDSGPGVPARSVFWASDIWFDQSAGTWQQVDRLPVSTTISAITANPASPAPQGTTLVALSATLSPNPNGPSGTVELFDGATDLGAANYNATTGAISKTATVGDNGTYGFKFVYSPTQPVGPSNSPVLIYRVKGSSCPTTTTLTGPTSATSGDNVSYSAAVTCSTGNPGSGDGTVQLKVDGTNAGNAVALDVAGHAALSYNGAAAGSHTITASFTPSDPTTFVASDSNPIALTVSAPANKPDPQTVQVSVPAGTLVISTPYTAANPFLLGTMKLNDAGTQFSAAAPFGDPNAAAAMDPGDLGNTPTKSPYPDGFTANGVTVTDTRPTGAGWTAYIQATDFTNGNGSTIDGNNLSFTGLKAKYPTGNNLTGKVKTYDVAGGMRTAKQKFADTPTGSGPGTVNITGTVGLTAPTSTQPGDYTATVTFTIV